jgi:hypothetical protein
MTPQSAFYRTDVLSSQYRYASCTWCVLEQRMLSKSRNLRLGFSGRLDTALMEKVNLTALHGIPALARRTWATVQQSPYLLAHPE